MRNYIVKENHIVSEVSEINPSVGTDTDPVYKNIFDSCAYPLKLILHFLPHSFTDLI